MKANKIVGPLETAIINLFRVSRNVVNISQLTAQLVQEPAFRDVGTTQVRSVVFRLEKDGMLKRETDTVGVTRFSWNDVTRCGCEVNEVVRQFFNSNRKIILKTGLTLEQAQEHCNDPETSSTTCTKPEGRRRTRRYGRWFDQYTEVK